MGRYRDRWSRRDALLSIVAAIWLVRGALVLATASPGGKFGPLNGVLDAFLASKWSALPWFACGAAAMAVAFRGRARKKATGIGVGFAALLIPSTMWTGFYLWSWLMAACSGGVYGNAENWAAGLYWGLVAVLVIVLSGLADSESPAKIGGAR